MLAGAMNVIVYALSNPMTPGTRGPWSSLEKWIRFGKKCPFQGSVERALWGGFHADRLGYAFAAGYRAALSDLCDHVARSQNLASHRPGEIWPDPPLAEVVALAATESGGAHPRAILTRLEKEGGALVLRGEKTYTTLGTVADELLVVASRGASADGKNRLRVVRVPKNAGGMTITPRGETPFAPEIPHALVRFDGVVVDAKAVMPGDGYDHWLKPFRTIEDIHVLAALTGHLLGVGRAYDWNRGVIAELTSLAVALVDLGARDASEPFTHVLLAGAFAHARRLVSGLDEAWAVVPEEERTRWERDRALLLVAESARTKRTEAAWRSVLDSVADSTRPK